jgi:nitrite reductase (NO-forming)
VIAAGPATDITWLIAAAVLLVVASLISWGLRLEADAERERRGIASRAPIGFWGPNWGRLLVAVVVLAAVCLGAVLIWDGPRGASAARPVPATLRVSLSSAHLAAHHVLGATHTAARAVSAAMPAAPRGPVAHVAITVEDRTIEIAPGVRYHAWTFNGHVPGPIIHVRQGQRVDVTFTNHGAMSHSLDLHAASLPPDQAFKDVLPGHSMHVSFVARTPGVFLYHCVTAPAVAHIANGMYGAMIIDPKVPLPRAARSFVLTAGEWYADSSTPANLNYAKALAMTPDYTSFNGRAFGYDERPLHVQPGERVRFYVLNAGPNLVLPFHVVGGIFDRAYPDGDMTHWLRDVQTTDVAPGGAAIFDVHFRSKGVYGFVSHSFANAEKGDIGTILVGSAHGSMSH